MRTDTGVVDRLLDVAAIDLGYGVDLRFSLEYCEGTEHGTGNH
jgi:hypothetical protein